MFNDVFSYFERSISWGELLKRTGRETSADNGFGLAAQLAYFFFLALFPALLVLLALAGFFASANLIDRVIEMMSGAAPPDVVRIIRDQLTQITQGRNGGLLTFGVLAALWSSSAALVAIIDALNRAFDVEDVRPWWKRRGLAVLLTIGLAVFVVLSITLVVAGPQLAEVVAQRVGLGEAFRSAWLILQWPVVFILIATAFGLIYHFAPDVDQDFVWLTPGSLVATSLWIVGSLGFRYYVVNFGSYNQTYGTIGGVMVLLLWLYLSGLVILIGAEMNAEIEHASEHGKEPGETTPGKRKTVGPRAERELRAKREREGPASNPGAARGPDARQRSMDEGYRHRGTADSNPVGRMAVSSAGGRGMGALVSTILGGVATKLARGATRRVMYNGRGTPRLPSSARRRRGIGTMMMWAAAMGVVLAVADVLRDQRGTSAQRR